jgi:hypothetical protein
LNVKLTNAVKGFDESNPYPKTNPNNFIPLPSPPPLLKGGSGDRGMGIFK